MSVPFGVFASSVEEGLGVASGGATGEVLAKASDLNFDTEWVAAATGDSGVEISATEPDSTNVLWADTSEPGDAVVPVGGATGQALVKASASDYDTTWVSQQIAGSGSSALNTAGAYFDGSTGLVLGGMANNGAQVPDSAALSPTVAIDIRAKVTVANWSSGGTERLVSKNLGGSNRQWSFWLRPDRWLVANVSSTGATDANAFDGMTGSAPVPGTNGQPMWVRFTFTGNDGAGNKVGKFYYSVDGSSWTQLGTTATTAGTTSIFDGTAPIDIGAYSGLSLNPLAGTIGRVVIRDGFDGAGSTVLDANFETAPANALAFTESSTNAATVSLVTTRYSYGLPNAQFSTIGTYTMAGNNDFYHPFIVSAPISVDMLGFEVTTGPSSNMTTHLAVYRSDNRFQPSGSPLITASRAVNASQTGVFRVGVTPVVLQPGAYLAAINSSQNCTMRNARGGLTPLFSGGNTFDVGFFAARSAATFTSSPSPWNSRLQTASGFFHHVHLRWESA